MQRSDFEYCFREPHMTPASRNAAPPCYQYIEENGMVIERDVPVMMRDGVRIYIDVFRPLDGKPVPPLLSWSPYGKHVTTSQLLGGSYQTSGVNLDEVSPYTAFEAPDPTYWVPRGYATIVANARGTWHSEGNATFCSPKEAEDFYDLIEWAGTQAWSNGKVGLSGVSYLTVAQWRVAELNPPHLAAINPWEGWSDTYREVARHGGIPSSSFWPYLHQRWGASVNRIEDLARETAEHPFFDAFWASKSSDLSKITVPAYVVASWSDQGLHTRGTLEGFKKIRSEQKWLEVHGRKKWAHYYDPESLKRQLAFFDHFLKGRSNVVSEWPKVRVEVREKAYVGKTRAENEWPIARTEYTRLYLNAANGSLQREPVPQETSASYDALDGGSGPNNATFDIRFDKRTELVGHMKLKVHMSAQSDDMDVFVAIQKFDREGKIVPFTFYAQYLDGPVALGWLRASHRELDEENSTEFQPVLAHRRELKLAKGEVADLSVEIWPSGTVFEAGETLRVVLQGTDIYRYPKDIFANHNDTVNRGTHVVHAGGKYDSYLLVPVISQ